jgi:FixJ family two-component response regulator
VDRAHLLIAVVDDEVSVGKALGRLLRLADYRVATFACGEDFLESLQVQIPACAVLDVQMPGLSGFEVQARMRAAQIPTPVVFITADQDTVFDPEALGATAVGLLRKPFSGDALLSALGSAIGHRHDHA